MNKREKIRILKLSLASLVNEYANEPEFNRHGICFHLHNVMPPHVHIDYFPITDIFGVVRPRSYDWRRGYWFKTDLNGLRRRVGLIHRAINKLDSTYKLPAKYAAKNLRVYN